MNDHDLRVVLEGRPVVLFVVGVLLTDKQEIFCTGLAPGPMRNAATATAEGLQRALQSFRNEIITLAPEKGAVEVTKIIFYSRIGDDGGVEISAHLSGVGGMNTPEIQGCLTLTALTGIVAARCAMLCDEVQV